MTGDQYDFGISDELATRVRQTLGASVHLVSHPGLAAALVSGSASAAMLDAVGKFVDGLELSKQVRLARAGGAALNLSDSERNLLGAVNENYQDVDLEYQQHLQRAASAANLGDPQVHGFWGHLAAIASSTGSVLFDNPVVRPIAGALNRAGDIAKTPYRTAFAGGAHFAGVPNPFTGKVYGASSTAISSYVEQAQAADAAGYDGGSVSGFIAYNSRGEQVFTGMDDLRNKYGSANVDVARDYVTAKARGTLNTFLDPEADADTIARRMQAVNDPKFQELITEVDARHASPGRQLARDLGLQAGTHPFSLISGATDGLVTWYADPTLILGKAAAGYKSGRLALDSMADVNGVRRIMYGNAAVQRGWTGLLDNARVIREGDDAEKAGALARIRATTPDLVPLVDEINGVRVVPRIEIHSGAKLEAGHGREVPVENVPPVRTVQPIETYDELVDHVVGTAALTRLTNGMAASQAVFMPGAVSRYGFRQLRALAAGKLTENGVKKSQMDFTKAPWRLLPSVDSGVDHLGNPLVATTDHASGAARSVAGDRGLVSLNDRISGEEVARAVTEPTTKGGKLRRALIGGPSLEAVSRRLTSMLPTASMVAYDSPEAVEQLRRFALTYMPKAQAHLYAAAFSNAEVSGRRAIYKGVVEQLIHASGMESTGSGKKLAEAMRSDLSALDKQKYSTTGLDTLTDDAGTRHVGLWPGQMNNEMWLPSFSQMNRAAAKVGVWDHTLGGLMKSNAVDHVMSTIRTGWLVTGAGALRNAMEAVGAFTARGQGFGNFMKARTSLSAQAGKRMLERELPDAEANLAAAKATMNDIPLSGFKEAQGEVHDAAKAVRGLRRRTTPRVVASQVPKLKVLSWLHRAAGVGLDLFAKVHPLKGLSYEDLERTAVELEEDTGLAHLAALHGIGSKAPQSTVTADGLDEAREITALGLAPKQVKFRLSGWDSVSADGESGARAWAHNLDQRFTEDGLGTAVLALLHHDTDSVQAVADMIRTAPALESFRQSSELLAFLRDKSLPREIADSRLNDFASRITADMLSVVSGKDGEVIEPLRKYLLQRGKAPSIDWLERNVPNDLRPEHAIGRKWIAAPPARNKVTGLTQGYANTMSRAYDMIVNRPVAWMSSHPIYAVNYTLARKNLAAYERALVDGGLDAERAAQITKGVAHQHAWDKTVSMIDDPEIQSHFAVLSRNWVNFYRAQEQFVRRWAIVLKEDPTRVRKAQLAFQAGVHSGMIDHDENGVPTFVYPGSGAAITSMIKAANLLPGVDLAQIPAVPNLTSKVMFLNPSLDNPLAISFAPVVSMPFHALQHFFPDHALGFSQADVVLNGQQGAGRPWWQYFVPTPVGRFMQALSGDDRRSQVASAARNAIVNLDAAGKLPGPGAAPDEVDQFVQRIQTGAKNQLMVRAMFAFFLPASPSLPEENAGGDANAADPVFQAQGMRTLKQEFRSLVNTLGYEKALAVWTKVHPDELAYTVGTTESKGGAFIPPTEEALKYMQSHLALFKDNPSVAAYFLPDAPGGFSPPAWNGELAAGLREYKDLGQFYGDVRIVTAERTYYEAQDRRDAALAEANAQGDKTLVRQLNDGWRTWAQTFLSINPLFNQKLAGYAVTSRQREAGVAELQQLATSGQITQFGVQSEWALQMLDAYNKHNQFTDFMRNRSDKVADAQKSAERDAYAAHQRAIVDAHPELRDLWNGLFRAPGDPRVN